MFVLRSARLIGSSPPRGGRRGWPNGRVGSIGAGRRPSPVGVVALAGLGLVVILDRAAAAVALAAAPSGAVEPGDADDGSLLPEVLMVAGVVVIALTLVRAIRRRGDRQAGAAMVPRERLDAIKAAATRHRPVDAGGHGHGGHGASDGVIDPVTAATRLAAILDTRAARVEQLLADVDDRLARLERATGRVEDDRAAPASDPPAATAAPAAPAATAAADTDHPPARDSDEPPPGDAAAARRRLALRIHELAASGLAPLAIARAVEAPIGEVELVLALGPAVAGAPAPLTAAEPEPDNGDIA